MDIAPMIYLDNQATTPLAPEARDAMLKWMGGPEDNTGFGNPHSNHRMGRMAAAAVELARDQVASLFPAGGQVIFTSGATEAINLAMRGLELGEGARIAVSAIEHSAVFDTAQDIGETSIIPVDQDGLTNPQGDLPQDTKLISIMQVNNEIGVVQPIDEWHSRAQEMGALLLCDGVQAYGKIPLGNADMIAITAHKFYGPKGIGALWVRDGIELKSVQTGGGQEGGLRSGTLSPALCAGMGAAASLAKSRMEEDAAHLSALWNRARELFADWELNGSQVNRWQGNLNIRRAGLDVGRLMSDCRNIMLSAGSACSSGSGKPSRVLRAIGLDDVAAKTSIRLGFGRYTTMDELEEAAAQILSAVAEQEL